VKYNSIRESVLLANNVNLIVVSIGLPEVGTKLSDHLNLDKGEEWVYCDPENVLYDALDLNGGITNFMTADTAFTFRDRIFGMNNRKDGMSGLFDVLSKWKDAVYVPPKTTQAFQQGGTFIFRGGNTVYAHYDAGAGAHADVDAVVEQVFGAMNE